MGHTEALTRTRQHESAKANLVERLTALNTTKATTGTKYLLATPSYNCAKPNSMTPIAVVDLATLPSTYDMTQDLSATVVGISTITLIIFLVVYFVYREMHLAQRSVLDSHLGGRSRDYGTIRRICEETYNYHLYDGEQEVQEIGYEAILRAD